MKEPKTESVALGDWTFAVIDWGLSGTEFEFRPPAGKRFEALEEYTGGGSECEVVLLIKGGSEARVARTVTVSGWICDIVIEGDRATARIRREDGQSFRAITEDEMLAAADEVCGNSNDVGWVLYPPVAVEEAERLITVALGDLRKQVDLALEGNPLGADHNRAIDERMDAVRHIYAHLPQSQ